MKLFIQGKTKTIFISLFLAIFLTAISFKNSFAETSNKAIDLINKERISRNLKQIKVDENLCNLAQILADDSEKAYPNKINTFNSKYRALLKEYPTHISSSITTSDVLIDLLKKSNGPQVLIEEEEIAQKVISDEQAINPEITRGCTAVSSGKIGYKVFAYFIGAVKYEDLNILTRIKLYFQGLFSIFKK